MSLHSYAACAGSHVQSIEQCRIRPFSAVFHSSSFPFTGLRFTSNIMVLANSFHNHDRYMTKMCSEYVWERSNSGNISFVIYIFDHERDGPVLFSIPSSLSIICLFFVFI